MQRSNPSLAEKKARIFVISASIAVPVLVSLLYMLPKIEVGPSGIRSFLNSLPLLNACLNGSCFIILILALIAIKNKNIALHRKLMTLCLGLSVLFLISYVSYHATTTHTVFPNDNPMKPIYKFILNTHIILSAVVVPLVLITFTRALAEKFDKHKKLARITLPVWLYVTLTGVIVYLMISPYYAF
jgi:putative membrane protein